MALAVRFASASLIYSLLRVIIFNDIAQASSIDMFQLKCHTERRLEPNALDKTRTASTLSRCLQLCRIEDDAMPAMRYKCKSVSYHPSTGTCVLSVLRIYSAQSVQAQAGWKTCTQKLGKYTYKKVKVKVKVKVEVKEKGGVKSKGGDMG